jgi:hypothetical protein
MTQLGKFTISLAIVACLAAGLVAYLSRPSYGRCDFFTKELNGGKKNFHGEIYSVRLCGADIKNSTEIKLQIFDNTGELLARRYFSYYVNSSTERDLSDGMDSIIYYDSSKEIPMQSLPIPPTKWDWIRARLPLF